MGNDPAAGPVTGGQICEAAAFSFLLLGRDGTRRAGGSARWLLSAETTGKNQTLPIHRSDIYRALFPRISGGKED